MTMNGHQPDEERPAICPTCRQRWPREEFDAEKFLRINAGNFPAATLAGFLCQPLERVKRIAARASPPIDLTLKKEPEPRGA